jgi:3-methylfumaryl-CoA hydratase
MNLKDWIGRTETVDDIVTAMPYAALSATLDREPARPKPGTPLPALWHWLYFLPLHRQREIGPDGHARRGGFLPPVALPRRMWAGSQLQFQRPLRVGDSVTRVSTIQSVSDKSGRSGALVFVRVRHEFRANDEEDVALTEFHDIVYREAAKPADVAPSPQAAPGASAWEKKWVPDEVLLFRYSADRDPARRSVALAAAGGANREVRVPRGAPAVRPPPLFRLRRAAARRQDVSLVGARP